MLPASLIGFSSKSYFTLEAALAWARRVRLLLADAAPADGAYVCVPHPLISRFADLLAGTGVAVGAQDVSVHPPGPYTGEVHAQLLADLGVRYVMAGHPERRTLFGEDLDATRRKVEATARAGMVPIVICGEPDRDEDPVPVLRGQLGHVFGGLPAGTLAVAAYEPAWAIGQREPAPPEHVVAAVAALRDLVGELGLAARVVYGGSATEGTYRRIGAAAGGGPGLPDGIFMGRGGLDPEAYVRTIGEVRAVGAGAGLA